MKHEELQVLAAELKAKAAAAGCKSFIVALSTQVDGHSEYAVDFFGPCLEVEGLAQRILHHSISLWEGKIKYAAKQLAQLIERDPETGDSFIAHPELVEAAKKARWPWQKKTA